MAAGLTGPEPPTLSAPADPAWVCSVQSGHGGLGTCVHTCGHSAAGAMWQVRFPPTGAGTLGPWQNTAGRVQEHPLPPFLPAQLGWASTLYNQCPAESIQPSWMGLGTYWAQQGASAFLLCSPCALSRSGCAPPVCLLSHQRSLEPAALHLCVVPLCRRLLFPSQVQRARRKRVSAWRRDRRHNQVSAGAVSRNVEAPPCLCFSSWFLFLLAHVCGV